MRKRQKFILIIYAFYVFFFSFLYVPYVRYYQGGVKTYAGNHLRSSFLWVSPQPTGHLSIDADLIIAQVLAFTAIAGAALLFFKRE
ncbi:MAG: hypothetical protein ACW97P_12490 [Candidatus Hodarchaeales archaeon]|jgi:hypothetical protein